MRKVIRKRIRYDKDGVQVTADINATIASNVGKKSSTSSVRSNQRIVQRSSSKKSGGKEERPKD